MPETMLSPTAIGLLWVERPISEILDYEEQNAWPDEEDKASIGNSKRYTVLKSMEKLEKAYST